MTRIIFIAIFFISIKTLAAQSIDKQKNASNTEGVLPPVLSFADLKKTLLDQRLDQHNDTTYIVNFWATWCAPCVAELPYFEKLNQQLAGKKAKVVLVSIDAKKQWAQQLKPFLKKKKLQTQVYVLDAGIPANDWISQVSPDWSGAIPVTFIFNRQKSKLIETDFESFEDLEKTVLPFLGN